MALLDRLRGAEDPKIQVHQFQAAMADWAIGGTGAMTRSDVINYFSITPGEEAQLDALQQIYADAVTNGRQDVFREAVHGILMLAEVDVFYFTAAQIQTRLQNIADGT